MRNFLITLALILPMLSFAQKLNRKATDEKKHNEMLIGYCNREGFESIHSGFDSCYRAGYAACTPSAATVIEISRHLKGLRVKVVMATWCSDSKDWVPPFCRIMDQAGFSERHLTFICVDRQKQAPGTDVAKLGAERVPTFIFYRKHRELGRIVEVPDGVFEEQILKIISQ
jgi:hypothetical protein